MNPQIFIAAAALAVVLVVGVVIQVQVAEAQDVGGDIKQSNKANVHQKQTIKGDNNALSQSTTITQSNTGTG